MAESKVIYDGRFYVACAMRDGSLTVQSKAGGMRGVAVSAPHAGTWIEAIATAPDATEARDLCKAVYQAR